MEGSLVLIRIRSNFPVVSYAFIASSMTRSTLRQQGHGPAVTLRDVAQVAGVSPITVSRAISNPAQLAPATLRRVMHAIAETGYVPNLVAGGLRSSRTGVVAIVVPSLKGLFVDVVQAITEAFESRNLQVILGQTGYSMAQEDKLLKTIVGRRPDGIVIAGVSHSQEIQKILKGSGIPVVETWDTTPDPIDMLVSISHEEISTVICSYLYARGRRRIALVSGNDARALRRNEVFLEAANALSLMPPVIQLLPAPSNHAGGRAALTALLASHPEIDAVVCSSDLVAMGVLTEARVRGIRIPRDLAVIGAGDMDFAASLSPSLTTVKVDSALLGRVAAKLITDRLDGNENGEKVINLSFALVERESS
jgi:LacI family gluconate utilization system Gnt-I transcriptional repressor